MSTITLPSENLVAALTAVLPMAGTDDTLPILTCVHFETRDGELMAVTTNRYLLGTYRVDATEIDGEVNANVQGRDVKDLLAFAKKAKRIPLTLTFDERQLTVSDFERKVTYSLLWEADFVKWAAIMPEDNPSNTVFGVNPDFIGRFAKAVEGKVSPSTPLRLSVGSPVKPIRATVGERFVGLIMPVRLPDEAKGETATYHDGNVTVTKAPEVKPEPEPVEPEVAAPESPDEPAEDDEAYTQWHESEVELADDPMAEEEGAETTPEWCESCKGFGVVRGIGSKAGQPYKTANGAATATTSVECPTCHGDKVVAA